MPGPEFGSQSVKPRIRRIGREPDNDVVINLPTVSGYHARIVWDERSGEAILEDLGSTNGTFLGSHERRITRAAINAGDTIYLGSHPISGSQLIGAAAEPAQPPLVFAGDPLVIGRDAGSDVVLDFAMVSGRHARIYRNGDQTLIEDLHSLNGTSVNGTPISRPTVVRPGDVLGFGSVTVVFRESPRSIATVTMPPAPQVSEAPYLAPPTSVAPAPVSEEPAFAQELARTVARPGLVALLLLQAPLAAALITLVFKTADRAVQPLPGAISSGAGVPAALSGLTLAAFWFGIANVVLSDLLSDKNKSGSHKQNGALSLLSRFVILGILGIIQCAIVWSIAAGMVGLHGSATLSIVLLALVSLAALGLALLVGQFARLPVPAMAFLLGAMVVSWVFGGQRWPLPRMSQPARIVAGLLPSRWAFEGLLLLDADWRASSRPAGATDSAPGADWDAATPSDGREPVQEYFPRESERMGPRADVLALVAIVLGVLSSAAFVAAEASAATARRGAERDR